jgi:hypothetical protein
MLSKVMPPGAAGIIGRAFDLMEVAEAEIKAEMARFPRAKRRINSAFGILCPPEGIGRCADEVYRAHVRELLGRVRRGEDTRPGTKAEALVALSHMSLKAPPGQQAAALQERLFVEIFGVERIGGSPHQLITEPWLRACDEMLVQLRRKLAVEGRMVKAAA